MLVTISSSIIFDNLIQNTGRTLWYTTVFGAALATASTLFALHFWMRRTEIQQRTAEHVSTQAAAFA
jgi:hypothetical protein